MKTVVALATCLLAVLHGFTEAQLTLQRDGEDVLRSTYNSAVDRVLGSALYAFGAKVLGRNLTDALVPFAPNFIPSFQEIRKQLPPVQIKAGRIVLFDNTKYGKRDIQSRDARSCVTADGKAGTCTDLSKCSSLLADLALLRLSVCLKSTFTPGVCCGTSSEEGNDRPPSKADVTTLPSPPIQPEFLGEEATPSPLPPVEPSGGGGEGEGGDHLPYQSYPCGVPQIAMFRIIGGSESASGQWPWAAAIFLRNNRRTEFWCAGSLINELYVLTAAHCTRDSRQRPFARSQFTVVLGANDVSLGLAGLQGRSYRVRDVRAHPLFSNQGFFNDIALMRLSRQVVFSPRILPVCLPEGLPDTHSLLGQYATVIGWGTLDYGGKPTSRLHEVALPLWSNEGCSQAYLQNIGANFLCAGMVQGGKDACQGDSGGPLMLPVDGRYTLLGIVSFGNRCAEPNYPGVYTNVAYYLDWIYQNMF